MSLLTRPVRAGHSLSQSVPFQSQGGTHYFESGLSHSCQRARMSIGKCTTTNENSFCQMCTPIKTVSIVLSGRVGARDRVNVILQTLSQSVSFSFDFGRKSPTDPFIINQTSRTNSSIS